jgi:hypothetical protein
MAISGGGVGVCEEGGRGGTAGGVGRLSAPAFRFRAASSLGEAPSPRLMPPLHPSF